MSLRREQRYSLPPSAIDGDGEIDSGFIKAEHQFDAIKLRFRNKIQSEVGSFKIHCLSWISGPIFGSGIKKPGLGIMQEKSHGFVGN